MIKTFSVIVLDSGFMLIITYLDGSTKNLAMASVDELSDQLETIKLALRGL